MPEFYLYSTPPDATITITLDNGHTMVGERCSANGRSDAHRFDVPAGTATQGALMHAERADCYNIEHRGILEASDPDLMFFVLDDLHLQPVPEAPPQPPTTPPDPNADPLSIIMAVYNLGYHDLSTKEGCGRFTEECCTALHDHHSVMWGHIKKTPGQNQFNGHAVDAVMLMTQAGSTAPGGYDLIHDSESDNATPVFNYAGVPDGALWYYPAAPLSY